MGVVLGLTFALMITCIPSFGVTELIGMSLDPEATWVTFIGTVSFMFGIGAALTGVLLMMRVAAVLAFMVLRDL
jgi:hypothetical protein